MSQPLLKPLLIQIEKLDAVSNFEKICEQGAYFCKSCQAFRETVEGAHGYPACARCKSLRLKWCPPVPGFKAGEELKSDPKRCHV